MDPIKGDNVILPMIKVLSSADCHNMQIIGIGRERYRMYRDIISKHGRKVLGLLGDPGLEAVVGMKVNDVMFGNGEIVGISNSSSGSYSVGILFESMPAEKYSYTFTFDGRYMRWSQRTCYVTAMPEPEEPKGWAWFMDGRGEPGTFCHKITKSEAEKQFGERLIHWIPERKEL